MVDGRGGAARSSVDVVVVGAGITGLTLCRELASRGRDPLVLEADDRPGGVIESRRVEGRIVELGPQRTRLTAPVARLVDELGLRGRLVTAPPDLPLYVLRDGRLRRAPLGPTALLRTDLLSLAGKLRFALEPLAGPPREDESVAECLRRLFGPEAYRHFLGPLFGGIYASDPERMPAAYSLVPLWRAFGAPRSFVASAARRAVAGGERPPACSFDAGLETLTRALAESCGDRLRLSAPVRRVEGAGRGFRVTLDGGDEVRARRVVLTVPAGEAARLLERLEEPRLDALRRLRYNPLAVVGLASPLERRGYGYQMSLSEEGFATRGVTWNASLFGRGDVHTAYLGGMGREEALERSDRRLADAAAREFRRATGAEARPLSVHRTRVPAHDTTWRHRDDALDALPAGVRVCANWESQAGIPSRVRRARSLAAELDRGLGPPGPGNGAPSAPAGATGAAEDEVEEEPRKGGGE